jgi:LmbE family N-acetylglucosaminyl deacetylase
MQRVDFPNGAALVMAHPDDEVLWASSVLSDVSRVILCFENLISYPEWTQGRRRSLAQYPLPRVAQLGLQESEVFNCAAWPEPEETDYGLNVRQRAGAMRGYSEQRYRDNHRLLVDRLRPLLNGHKMVITHNPWGEYGHEEHVQVFRAVADLQGDLGFDLLVTGYVSNKSYPLMLRHLPRLEISVSDRPTDPKLGTHLKALYTQNQCWTWFDDYVWPNKESFYRWLGPGEQPVAVRSGSFLTFNTLWIKWAPLRRQTFLRRALRRSVRLVRR